MVLTFLSTLFYIFVPTRTARRWLTVSVPFAAILAVLHLLTLPFWMLALFITYTLYQPLTPINMPALRYPLIPSNGVFSDYFARFAYQFKTLPNDIHGLWQHSPPLDRAAAISIPILSLFLFFLMIFFVLLPFAARPGSNKPAIRHTLRTVFLSTGILHLACFLLALSYVLLQIAPHNYDRDIPIRYALLILLPLTLWIFHSLIKIVRADYRAPRDLPQPHDPWCDQCGYNLTGAAENNVTRCPECGKPIQESIGPATRPPTPWETAPSLLRWKTITRQLKQLILRPRELFFSMPTLTGQPPAQRWLIFSETAVGLLAFGILPGVRLFFVFDLTLLDLLLRSAAIALVWALLGFMMVGIETAGIATFSRMKKHPGGGVALATAAKVTAYSSILMLPWVLLGFTQIIVSLYWFDNDFGAHRHSIRAAQVFLAGSLAIAHIGGLLWYELTVYRGIKAIQYANK